MVNPAVITLFSFATSAVVLASPHVYSNRMLIGRLVVVFTIACVLANTNTFMSRSHFINHQAAAFLPLFTFRHVIFVTAVVFEVRLHQCQSTQRKMENENMELKATAMKAEIVRLETQERGHKSKSEGQQLTIPATLLTLMCCTAWSAVNHWSSSPLPLPLPLPPPLTRLFLLQRQTCDVGDSDLDGLNHRFSSLET